MRAVENDYEPALLAMSKLQWGTIEYVGDQSEYVSQIHGTLKTCVGAIQELIANKRYFRTFCDKFIEYGSHKCASLGPAVSVGWISCG